jgi:hypothetical protein
MRNRPRIDVHIEELVFHGIPPADRRAIREAIQREIARGLRAPGAPLTRDRSIERIDGGRVTWGGASAPQALGAQVARAVAGGLHSTEPRTSRR